MTALDHDSLFGAAHILPLKFPRLRRKLNSLVLRITLGALVLVLGAMVFHGFADNGFRLGSQLAWRYAFFAFFAALAGGPVCRILDRFMPQVQIPDNLSRKLTWGFCASYGVYLLSVFVPNVLRLSAGAMLMVLFGALVAVVMALTAAPLKRLGGRALVGEKTRRAVLATAAIYFWLCYALMALAHISGPHRPDAFYGLSLSLMVSALLLRYADRWLGHRQDAAAAH